MLEQVRRDLLADRGDNLLPARRRGQEFRPVGVVEVATWMSTAGRDCGVALVRLDDHRDVVVPVTNDEGSWRRARPGDGVSAAVLEATEPLTVDRLGALPPHDARSERELDADMSNDVVVVSEAIAVKWQFVAETNQLAGPRLAAHLAAVGFDRTPTPLATVMWGDRLIASATAYLSGASDGWDWMATDLLAYLVDGAPRPRWPGEVGSLVAEFHRSCATASAVFPEPVTTSASLAPLAEYYRDLLAEIPALDDEMRAALLPWMERFEHAVQTVEEARDVSVMPIHGDLHIGQIWRWSGGLVVGDFDGNPLLSAEHRADPGPAAFDLACLLRSFDHVALVVARRLGEVQRTDLQAAAFAWVREARVELLTAYDDEADRIGSDSVLDLLLLHAFEALSPLHEAVYAATYLPRWRYVPLGVLKNGW